MTDIFVKGTDVFRVNTSVSFKDANETCSRHLVCLPHPLTKLAWIDFRLNLVASVTRGCVFAC